MRIFVNMGMRIFVNMGMRIFVNMGMRIFVNMGMRIFVNMGMRIFVNMGMRIFVNTRFWKVRIAFQTAAQVGEISSIEGISFPCFLDGECLFWPPFFCSPFVAPSFFYSAWQFSPPFFLCVKKRKWESERRRERERERAGKRESEHESVCVIDREGEREEGRICVCERKRVHMRNRNTNMRATEIVRQYPCAFVCVRVCPYVYVSVWVRACLCNCVCMHLCLHVCDLGKKINCAGNVSFFDLTSSIIPTQNPLSSPHPPSLPSFISHPSFLLSLSFFLPPRKTLVFFLFCVLICLPEDEPSHRWPSRAIRNAYDLCSLIGFSSSTRPEGTPVRCEYPREGFPCPCLINFLRFSIFPRGHGQFHYNGSMDMALKGRNEGDPLCVGIW